MNIDQIKLNTSLYDVVLEPNSSRNILQDLQQKYNMNTMDFISLYKQGFLPPVEDFKTWVFQYKLFIAAEGDLGELIGEFLKPENGDLQSVVESEWNNQDGQPLKKTEVDTTSVFFFRH